MKKTIFFILMTLPVFLFGQVQVKEVEKTKQGSNMSNLQWNTESTVIKCSNFGITKPVREMKSLDPQTIIDNNDYPFREAPDKRDMPVQTFEFSVEKDGAQYGNDPSIIQTKQTTTKSRAPLQSWDGYVNAGGRPNDPTGAAGPNYYIQATNGDKYVIYNKSGVQQHIGNISDLVGGDGDPIVFYDKPAGRWFIAQFGGSGDNGLYFAISQTGDPMGAWYSYSFMHSEFPDYEKFSAWHDGYYMTANYSQGIYAFDRTKMLAGDGTATAIFKAFSPPQSGFFVPMPADASDGVMPTSGPCPIFCYQDNAWASATTDAINIYDAAVDFGAGTLTVTLNNSLNTSAFDASYDSGWDDVAQPGTSQMLDGIGGAMWFRSQWKTFSGYNTTLVCWGVQVTPTQRGIFWGELRQDQTTKNWSIYQQGIYAPGTDNVWLGSIAMNDAGHIALAYAKTNVAGNVPMSLAYTGRLSCDPLGTLPIPEVIAVAGAGYQEGGLNRVGDYAQTSLDPDGVTFWHTNEYTYQVSTWSAVKTRVYSFQLPGACAAPANVSATPTTLFEDRGKQITVTGTDMGGCSFTIGGVVGTVVSNDGSTAVVNFPAGNYTNSILTVENAMGSDTDNSNITVDRRNIIPVVAGAATTSDNHPTIQSAVDGLHAWYGTTAFNAGDLSGTKTINVYAGTYTDEVVLNSELNPVAGNLLVIQNNTGDIVTVDATGNDYGFNLNTVDYVTLTGFNVETANLANIYAQGDNVTISYNKTTGSVEGSGIKVETGTPFTITNNLAYSNFTYGIEVLSGGNTIKNNTADDNGGTSTPILNAELWSEKWESGSYTGWTVSSTGAGTWGVTTGDAANDASTGTGYANFSSSQNNSVQTSTLTYSNTPQIDISGYTNIEITCMVKSVGIDAGETFYGEYQIDGGGWISISPAIGSTVAYTSYGNATPIVTSGAFLELRFVATNNKPTEIWYLDDIIVIGDEDAVASNTGAGLYVASVAASVENNIFVAKTGSDDYYSLISPGNTITSDYNTYYTTNTNLFDYNGATNNVGPVGANDLSGASDPLVDPKFVGGGDYHIVSTAGSYNGGNWPPTTAAGGTWTNHPTDDSPAIDAANGLFANEPAPNGGVMNQGAYGNTLQASKSPTVVAAHNWTGNAGTTDWQTTGNWDLGTIPLATENVVIPDVSPNPFPVIDDGATTALCNNIIIEASASVTIATNGQMTVSGAITNNAGNTGLVIQSDATGTGSLIHNSTTDVDATVSQILESAGRAWHMVGSPVSDATVAVFPSTTYLYNYDESVDDYWTGSTYDSPTNGWTNYTSGALDVNKGYLYNDFQTTLTFAGKLNKSTDGAGIALPYTDNGVNAANGSSYADYDGWNLISNPFTSAIDWTATDASAAKIYDAIYIWDDAAGTYKSYVVGTNSWNAVGTVGGSQYIAPMQGFFVKGDATQTAGTLEIPAAARLHNSVAFLKSQEPKETPNDFLRLQVQTASGTNTYQDEIIVRFDEQASNNMDNRLDAYKLFSHYAHIPQIYTNGVEASTEYSINTLANLEEGETVSVPLKIHSIATGYTISASEFNFENIKVYLKDNNVDGKAQELNRNSVLNFTTSQNDETDRFELIFEKEVTTGTPETIFDVDYNVTIYPNPNTGEFYLRVDDYEGNYKVRINSVTGSLIYTNSFEGKDYNIINLSDVNTGIYFITVIIDNSAKYERIIIK